jgi:hypothetical protein
MTEDDLLIAAWDGDPDEWLELCEQCIDNTGAELHQNPAWSLRHSKDLMHEMIENLRIELTQARAEVESTRTELKAALTQLSEREAAMFTRSSADFVLRQEREALTASLAEARMRCLKVSNNPRKKRPPKL